PETNLRVPAFGCFFRPPHGFPPRAIFCLQKRQILGPPAREVSVCYEINRFCFGDVFLSRHFCNHARSIPCFLLKYFGLDWDPLAIFCRRRFHAELLFSALRLRFHSSDARNEDAAQPCRTGANRTFARPYHFYSPVVRDHFTAAAAQSRSEADLWPGRAAWSD